MTLDTTLRTHLDDSRFDADWSADIPYAFDAAGRNAVLAKLVRGDRVIHLGFADHGPLIRAKREAGTWLHDRIAVEAAALVGVDIDAQSVALAQSLGVPDLHCLDVFGDGFAELVRTFEPTHLLLPDVLEHLHAPVGFVQRLAQVAPQAQLVISVPNGLSLRNAIQGLRGIERINTDHLCWYSPFTTLKLLRRGGYAAEGLWAAQIAAPGSLAGRVAARLIHRRPLWADNLVVAARAVPLSPSGSCEPPTTPTGR